MLHKWIIAHVKLSILLVTETSIKQCILYNNVGNYIQLYNFLNELEGSTQSNQWRIELLCRYKRAKTTKITVLSIRKLFALSAASHSFKKIMLAQHHKSCLLKKTYYILIYNAFNHKYTIYLKIRRYIVSWITYWRNQWDKFQNHKHSIGIVLTLSNIFGPSTLQMC